MNHQPTKREHLLQQQLIHFRSEKTRLENELKKLHEKLVEEKNINSVLENAQSRPSEQKQENTTLDLQQKLEQMNNKVFALEQALQSKANQKDFESLFDKIMFLNEKIEKIEELENNKVVSEKDSRVNENSTQKTLDETHNEVTSLPYKRIECIPTLNYSIILPESSEDQLVIHGHFVIRNTGSVSLTNPKICLKTKPSSSVVLSGKILGNSSSLEDKYINVDAAISWSYIQENWMEVVESKGEHWLQPVELTEIGINGLLSFASFDLHLTKPEDSNSIFVEAYFYCDEIEKGIKSYNSILVNY